jgi:endonuclease/exonuclease/phosphatase (EEP) superfamily protein YafD
MIKKIFLSIFRFTFLIGVIFSLLGIFFSAHPILGMILNLIRWPMLIVAIIWIWRKGLKPHTAKGKLIWGIAILLLLQWSWKKVNFNYSTKASNSSHTTCNLLSYNLFFKNRQPQSALQVIRSKEVDFMAFQEVTSGWQAKLTLAFSKKLPYHRSFPHRSAHGLAVFSKYPIQRAEYLKNANGLPFAQIVEVKIKNKKVLLANVHLSSPAIAVEQPERFFPLFIQNADIRSDQLEQLLSYMNEQTADSKILLGDFNSMKFEPNYAAIRSDYVDLFAKKGEGRSWNFPHTASVPFPILTLDYIFVSGDCKALACEVLQGGSSDHLAIWGKIEF